MQGIGIFGSPGRYVQGAGAVNLIGHFASLLGKRATLVADPLVMNLAGDRIVTSCEKSGVQINCLAFEGELTFDLVSRLTTECEVTRPDFIIAAGGGRSIDTGKALSKKMGCPIITVPTAASNDAPTSKNYVLYDEHHRLAAVEHLISSPAYVVVDTALIANAPAALLRAGIGDAIAKKFEADQCAAALAGLNMFQARPLASARVLSDACFATLLDDAAAALQVAGTGRPNTAFERVVEATILMAGLGFESGGLSVAHAMTRGLSVLREVNRTPHGFQVAYGLLVQIELEQRNDGIRERIEQFHADTGLPRSLAQLGLQNVLAEELDTVAELTLAAPHAKNFKRVLTQKDIVAAMLEVERRAQIGVLVTT
ncbi:glycerol dehydrogenase [Herbaspirillum sp. GCM10030257]|uniref:glycerol dehydrogenase n=1 Tax=Herbaspirillum sp. GCM10030257 TaxID=3273393 RepID=UPI003614A86D